MDLGTILIYFECQKPRNLEVDHGFPMISSRFPHGLGLDLVAVVRAHVTLA